MNFQESRTSFQMNNHRFPHLLMQACSEDSFHTMILAILLKFPFQFCNFLFLVLQGWKDFSCWWSGSLSLETIFHIHYSCIQSFWNFEDLRYLSKYFGNLYQGVRNYQKLHCWSHYFQNILRLLKRKSLAHSRSYNHEDKVLFLWYIEIEVELKFVLLCFSKNIQVEGLSYKFLKSKACDFFFGSLNNWVHPKNLQLSKHL